MSSVDPYDPTETDDSRGGSSYVSRKDLKWIFLILVVLFLLMIPIFKFLKGNAQEYVCKTNLNKMGKALALYFVDWGERYPPLFNEGGTGIPAISERGAASTWLTVVADKVDKSEVFTCPSATEEEWALSEGAGRDLLHGTYGFYSPYALELVSAVANPGSTVIIAETSNLGGADTHDPLTFVGPSGEAIRQDGFAIGFDDNQFYPTANSKTLTRLAFPNSKGGAFGPNAGTRHREHSYALSADLSLLPLKPGTARYRTGSSSYWNVPPKR